jgi:hypothetical protein
MAKGGGAVRWTPEQLAAYKTRRGKPLDMAIVRPGDQLKNRDGLVQTVPGTPAAPVPSTMDQFYALGRLAKGKMNKTEAAYAQILAARKHDGTILDWKFHAIRVRLADNTFYEPDFLVLSASGQIEIHETKGSFTTQAGQTKVKLCAEVLPWFRVFKCSRQKNGEWIIHEFNK